MDGKYEFIFKLSFNNEIKIGPMIKQLIWLHI